MRSGLAIKRKIRQQNQLINYRPENAAAAARPYATPPEFNPPSDDVPPLFEIPDDIVDVIRTIANWATQGDLEDEER